MRGVRGGVLQERPPEEQSVRNKKEKNEEGKRHCLGTETAGPLNECSTIKTAQRNMEAPPCASLANINNFVNHDKFTRHSSSFRDPLPDIYIWLPVVYSIICAVGLTGNTAVIYVILKAPKMKTVTNMFILNLAIADDLFTLVLPINIAEHLLNYWPFGEVLCKVILSIDHYNIFSSIYFLTAMSVDRYLVVVSALHSKRMPHRTYRFAKTVSVCVWSFVILIVMPFTFFAGIYVTPDDTEKRKSCVLSFPNPEMFWFKASRIYTLVLSFVIPVSTICVVYSVMLYKLRHTRLNSNGKALDKAKKKVTVMVFIVLAVCLFCWTPFHLSTVVALTTDLPTTPLVIGISYLITGLSYANSCLNPFLYAFLDDSFRKAFKKLLVC
ncbi:G protein-coupled receptor 8 [Electrophorus electricus]|uniref:G protein-coupled receptor 8 n=1 Tax=Electrophorus electricus TaxID=8005 RepID=UPI0015D038B9|nr:G protein-coupled receptor 8 [Electrophorus electricus]